MSPNRNEPPNKPTEAADATDGYWQGPVVRRDRAALDVPAGRPSLLGRSPSTSVATTAAERRAESQLESLIEQVDDYAVFVLDERGHVGTWNDGAETLTGYARGEILGEHLSTLYHAVEADKPKRILRSATEDRVVDRGWLVCADGSTFRAETTVEPLHENGSLTGFVYVVQNVTDRGREKELLDRCEQLQELITATSHDLRGPLTVAAGNTRLAEETGDDSYLDAVTRAIDRIEELLDCFTTLAEEGERIAEPEPVELREVSEAAWDVVETDGGELCVEGETVLLADRPRVQQLLENLLGNAVEHGARQASARDARGDSVEHSSTSSRTQSGDAVEHGSACSRSQTREDSVEHGSTNNRAKPDDTTETDLANDGGEADTSTSRSPSEDPTDLNAGIDGDVTVRVGPLPSREGFYVEDDGSGIPADEREQVFESGYSTTDGGTGFGLAIVRTIAEAHDWSIDVTEGRAGGARFEIATTD